MDMTQWRYGLPGKDVTSGIRNTNGSAPVNTAEVSNPTNRHQRDKLSNNYQASLRILALSIWPLSFIFGHSIIGYLGGGYQLRFILPALPATSISSCLGLQTYSPSLCNAIFAFLLAYSAIHTLFYGILFAPYFADLKYSILDMISIILASPYDPTSMKQDFTTLFEFLHHFGLKVD